MNRRILIQVTTPALLIGLLLLIACLASAWYINRLQTNLNTIRLENVASLQAALDLEMSLRQLRYHDFLYLGDPQASRLARIQGDRDDFKNALRQAQQSARSAEEIEYVSQIEEGYQGYDEELARLREEVRHGGKSLDFQQLVDAHTEPMQRLIKPCEELLRTNRNRMRETAEESERASQQASLAMLLLGLGGPVGGLICGYGIARGLSRSIYRLSVRVQDITQRLDQDVASVSVAADGDIATLDRQLQHVVGRVEEVAERVQRHQREMLRAEQLSAVGQL